MCIWMPADPLELELPSTHAGNQTGNQTPQEQQVLLTAEPSVQPQNSYFLKLHAYLKTLKITFIYFGRYVHVEGQ